MMHETNGKTLIRSLAAGVCLLAASGIAQAQSVEEFYKGKTISMLVGSSAGGGYDTYARLVSRHLGRFIPGNPGFVIQNIPGGGGMQVTNNLYNVAPKDGTAMGTIQRGLLTTPLLESRNIQVRYDPRRFNWLGSLNTETGLVVAWHTTPHRTFEDLQKHELIVGSSSPSTEFLPLFLNNVLKTKLKMVAGYKGSTEAYLALERGEVSGRVSTGWSGDKEVLQPWIDAGKVRLLVALSVKKSQVFPELPLIMDFARNEEDRQVMELILASQVWGRPFVMPPGVPQDRLAAVKGAFDKMVRDPEFLEEAGKLRMDLEILSSEEMKELLDRVYATPPEVVERARQAIATGG
ncbi:MAG: tripartite tricarboxylate transporter family receptor [Hyphomicrobiales bacterium]|nr:tripartite tricarboxylate transporter family receptor [Hyphomicrobiales bacterium]